MAKATKESTAAKRPRRKQSQPQLRLPPPATNGHLDITALETWLWDAACAIRGAADAPKFKDFILPLIFYKRLSDVFDDEFAQYKAEFGDAETAHEVIEADHQDALRTNRRPIVRFYVPEAFSWRTIRNLPADGTLGDQLTRALRGIAALNPELQGVLDIKDYNEKQSGQRTLDDDRLSALVEIISRHRLGLNNAEADLLGQAYEYLLRKFAEGQGQSAGEFLTPKEAGLLMAQILNPGPKMEVYDPTCGTASLLMRTRQIFEQRNPDQRAKAPKLYGQELNPVTFAMAKMNMFLHGYEEAYFAIGDTFTNPGHAAKGSGLKRFDYAVANPMWNQDNYDEAFYENDPYDRFKLGIPPKSSADWGWAQHILASLNDNGRAAIVLDTGAVSRGSGSKGTNKEKEIRKQFIEHDFVEGVILLPDNLFYNTTAPAIVLLLNRSKPTARKEQILLINLTAYFIKEKPKNVLTDAGIAAAVSAYTAWETRPKLSRIITLQEARDADYNLSPSQFVEINDKATHRSLAVIMADLDQAHQDRERADAELARVLAALNLSPQGMIAAGLSNHEEARP